MVRSGSRRRCLSRRWSHRGWRRDATLGPSRARPLPASCSATRAGSTQEYRPGVRRRIGQDRRHLGHSRRGRSSRPQRRHWSDGPDSTARNSGPGFDSRSTPRRILGPLDAPGDCRCRFRQTGSILPRYRCSRSHGSALRRRSLGSRHNTAPPGPGRPACRPLPAGCSRHIGWASRWHCRVPHPGNRRVTSSGSTGCRCHRRTRRLRCWRRKFAGLPPSAAAAPSRRRGWWCRRRHNCSLDSGR